MTLKSAVSTIKNIYKFALVRDRRLLKEMVEINFKPTSICELKNLLGSLFQVVMPLINRNLF